MAGREPESRDEYDVPAWVITLGRLVGLTPVQTRWKAARFLRSMRGVRRDLAPPSSRRPGTQMCPSCGAWQAGDARRCASCGKRMASAPVRFLRNVGLSLPPMVSVSSLLALAMIVVYARMWLKWPGEALGGWNGETLIQCGSNFGPLTLHGQWWRAATCIFLHIGVMHIGFNVLALAQIGPSIEEIFGRGRMALYFLLTGLAASFASAALHTANAAGASGALMGLVGIAAGWGQRLGTPHGKHVRDQMLKWGAYTVVFGFVIHADNVAHVAGFVAGALLGFVHDPRTLDRTRSQAPSLVMGVLGGLGTLATVVLVLFLAGRASSAMAAIEPDEAGAYDGPAEESVRAHLHDACELAAKGDKAGALRLLFGGDLGDLERAPEEQRDMLLKGLCEPEEAPDGGLEYPSSP
jgi:membrane associated rhomboid family serine protease